RRAKSVRARRRYSAAHRTRLSARPHQEHFHAHRRTTRTDVVELFGGAARKIDDRVATLRDAAPRPAIHDTHHHRAPIPFVRHTHDSAEWQRPMRSVRLTLQECDTARSTAPLE